MQKVFGFMNTQMLEQSEYLGLKRAKRYVRALTELCNEHIDIYSDVTFSLPLQTSVKLTNLNNTMVNIFRKVCDAEEKLYLQPQVPTGPDFPILKE